MPETAYPSIDDMTLRLSCYAAEIALRVYFQDIRKLVHDNVHAILQPFLNSNNRAAKQDAKDRYACLSKWCDEDYPLSYDPRVLSNLLRSVTPQQEQRFELTASSLGQRPLSFLVDAIIRHASGQQHRRQPPFIQVGHFLPVIRVAIDEIRSNASIAGHGGPSETMFIRNAITLACETLQINHVPWSRNQDNHSGRAPTIIVHDVWLNLGAKDKTLPPAFLSQQQSNNALAFQASQKIQAKDPRGQWSALDIRLNTFHTVLHKTNLPSEWDIEHVMDDIPPYIIDAYSYVQRIYNSSKPLHQLAVICSIICAGIIPNIFAPEMKKIPQNKTQYLRYIQGLEWVTRDRRGTSISEPFITMVSSFIITMYDDTSPLWKEPDQKSVRSAWFKKHCAYLYSTSIIQPSFDIPMSHSCQRYHCSATLSTWPRLCGKSFCLSLCTVEEVHPSSFRCHHPRTTC